MNPGVENNELKLVRTIDDLPRNARVFIYGTGSAGRSLFVWLKKCRPDIHVKGFIDSFKSGKTAGKKIYTFEQFQNLFNKLHPSQFTLHNSFLSVPFPKNVAMQDLTPYRAGTGTSPYQKNPQVKNSSVPFFDLILIASGANVQIAQSLEKAGIFNYRIISIPTYLMDNLLPESFEIWMKRFKIKMCSLFSLLSKPPVHLFFGEHGGKFIGNNKYYFLYLRTRVNNPIFWVVEDDKLYDELKSSGIPVLDFRAKGFIRYLLQASYFYFDNMTWQRKYPWLRFFKAKIIHTSHGVGLKLTEKMLIPKAFMNVLTPREVKKLESKIFQNDLLISTSDFYAHNVSVPAYSTPIERVICSGYPKNDIFYKDIEGETIFTDVETLSIVDRYRQENYKVIVYAPTFRDMDTRFDYSRVIDYPVFDRYLHANRLILVIKGHTGIGCSNGEKNTLEGCTNIFIYANDRDGYPLLKRADLLITDYSSIYMDFMHRRKPVVYFVYDYREYIEKHRDIQFDYEKMTPGPKAKDYEELVKSISHFLIEGKDGFESKREEIFRLAYLYQDGEASERIYDNLFHSQNSSRQSRNQRTT